MKSPLDLLHLYLTQLWVHLSAVRMSSDKEQTSPGPTVNRTYLATFIASSIAIIHGTFGLHIESGRPLTIKSLRGSPFLFWRQCFSRQIWPQMDIATVVLFFSDLVTLQNFALKAVEWKHQFVIDKQQRIMLNGKAALSQYESAKLLAVFRRARLAYKIFGCAYYPPGLLYNYAMVFLVSQVYFVSFWSFAYWFIFWPFKLLMIILFLFLNLIHIILSGSCIQIRQQYHYQKFAQVLLRLTQRRRPKVVRLERAWHAYHHFNRAILSIGLQLEAFSTFYANYLTLVFLKYTVIHVLITYVLFFAPSDTLAMLAIKSIFVVSLIAMTVLLFGIIEYCARVVKKNRQIGRLNRAFAVHCLQNKRRYRLPIGQLLKLELLQWPRLLHFYAFKLFGNSRITSKTFYAMAINISGFFLFVLKRMQ